MSAGSANFDLAITAATISILIGGILFGAGLGFSIRRLCLLGAEEIGQGIVSAAMLGCLMSFALLLQSAFSSMPLAAPPSCPQITAPSSSPHAYLECNLASLELSQRNLASLLFRASDITGFASSLQISLGVVSAQPFFALQSVSQQLSGASSIIYMSSALSFLELELSNFIQASALAVFLPAGLLLRTFFATRKLGAAAMAIAIAAYAVYPLLFTYTFTVSGAQKEIASASQSASDFDAKFASLPLLELDETSAVKDKMDEMSSGDFGAQAEPLLPSAMRALALSMADLAIYPLLALAVSTVAAFELYRLLSAPIFLPYFSSV
ncbi:MAG: hypothetical protein NTX79_04375 [Candidatus Micrarchaeota archaeon]|nr:hypothetical protein [Candidatus Micrarchaeota archaeon]